MRKIFIAFLCLSLISGCARHSISKKLRDFSRATVTMVDGMQSVCHRNISSSVWDNNNNKIRFVMYQDSLSCNSCQINHLNDYLCIYEKADTMSFDVLTIFSPRQEEYDEVNVVFHPGIFIFCESTFFLLYYKKRKPGISCRAFFSLIWLILSKSQELNAYILIFFRRGLSG